MSEVRWEALQEPWLALALQLEPWGPLGDGEEERRRQLVAFYQALVRAVDGELQGLYEVLEAWVAHLPQPEEGEEAGELVVLTLCVRLEQVTREVLQRYVDEATCTQALARLGAVWTAVTAFAARREFAERLRRLQTHWEQVRQDKERLEQAKSTFISVAAHELRTPLTLIEGYTAMLQEQVSHRADLVPLLEGIRRGVRRMQEIINDLVDLSQIYAHQLEIAYQPVWLNRILYALADDLAPVLEERNLTLEVRPFPGSNVMFLGDPERLRQVFYNLLTNAIKYTPDGGRITVDGRLLPGFVEVTVSDTGIGIAPEDQEHIFERFTRLGNPLTHSSSKTRFKGGGPGLGLPIAKGIVEAHGGTIWVESEGYDEVRCPGSTFHVLLPLRQEPPGTEDNTRERLREIARHLRGE